MRGLVVDASVAVKWVVAEPGSEEAAALAGRDLAAPELLLAECANVLWVKHRRGELSPVETRSALSLLCEAPVLLVPHRELVQPALELALTTGQTAYDCLYLALAIEREGVLVTADRRFAAAIREHAPELGRRLTQLRA